MDPADPTSDGLRDRLSDGKCLKIDILSFSTGKIVTLLLFYSSFYGEDSHKVFSFFRGFNVPSNGYVSGSVKAVAVGLSLSLPNVSIGLSVSAFPSGLVVFVTTLLGIFCSSAS